LRTINRLEEGDTILYRPILRSGEERRGEVAMVLAPANRTGLEEKLLILDPKPANKPQQWKAPWRVSVVAFVYGPSGLNMKKVKDFLDRDDDLIAQLADYAEKTAQTEALISALSAPASTSANVQSALQGFSSQYGLNVQINKTAPTDQQAMMLFRALNPAIAGYDPISPQGTQEVGRTAGLATSVATLFFGSPVGLAAGGTAMLLELRALAFPHSQFRSALSESMPNDGLGLCGRRDPAPPHTKVAYLWASRVPNSGPPQISIEKAYSLPTALKSALPATVPDQDWKFVDRARNWALLPESGKPIPIQVRKLGETKMLELDLGQAVKPGTYSLVADWDWDHFQAKGHIEVKPLSDFAAAKLIPAAQDLLVAKTGKTPVTLEGSDFEFVTKVEIEKVNDKFGSPSPVPFVLPRGLRQGPQERMDVQVNTIDLDAGDYKLLLTQVDGKAYAVNMKILPALPSIGNFPVVLNEGDSTIEFHLKGQRLDLLKRVEVARGTAELEPPSPRQTERKMTLRMAADIDAGTSLAAKAYIEDRSAPLTFADAVRIVGPRPKIMEVSLSQPPDQTLRLEEGELPGGMYLSAMMRVHRLQSNSVVALHCGAAGLTLRLGERSGPNSLQQLSPDQVFLSFDTSVWFNGCPLLATIANGAEGESEPYTLGRIVRVPKIERFEVTADHAGDGEIHANLLGQNLETIEKTGWSAEQGEAVAGLPLPVAGEGQKQTLQVRMPPPPAPQPPLYVWLRGESKARVARGAPGPQ
jgi:hypothetical protein